MAKKLKARLGMQMLQISLRTRKEIIDAENLVPLIKQTIYQMGSKEPGSTGYNNSLPAVI